MLPRTRNLLYAAMTPVVMINAIVDWEDWVLWSGALITAAGFRSPPGPFEDVLGYLIHVDEIPWQVCYDLADRIHGLGPTADAIAEDVFADKLAADLRQHFFRKKGILLHD